MRTKIKIVDLFSGVGGLSYGFTNNDNFEIVAANENSPKIAKAYLLNYPNVDMFIQDIKNFGIKNIKDELVNNIDIVIGGPPCQAYSTLGKRLMSDPRAKLFQEYYRVLKEFNPKFFVFENVKGIMSIDKGKLLETIISLFNSLGYRVQYKLLNAADYGVPQIRERVIIVGSKVKKEFKYPKPTHYDSTKMLDSQDHTLKPYLTLADAISDLPLIESNEESFKYATKPQNDFQKIMRIDAPQKLSDHNSPNNNSKLVQIMKLLPEGGTVKDLPKWIRPKSGFANTYSRLWYDRPSTTITRNLSTPSSSRCIHPKAPRPLTTREGARIQCFPDSYKFYGTRSDRNLQIGNAVPTFLSNVLANAILDNFK